MRKLTIFIIIFWTSFAYSQQDDTSLVGVKLGYVQNGFGINFNYDYFIDSKQYISGDLLLTFAEDVVTDLKVEVPYHGFYLNGGYNYQFYETYRETITLSGGAGLSLGYQILNNGNKELSSGAIIASNSKFVFGGFIGVDSKFYISRKISALVSAKQFYHANSDIGNFFPFISAGVSYTLF